MKIGIPREVKNNEYRVGITPVGVRELVNHGHEVPEVDIPGEGPEEVEEVGVAAECICERVRPIALVVAAYAFDGQVESVGDGACAPACLIDRPLPFDPKACATCIAPPIWKMCSSS